jgi:hypothetical protein
MDRHVWGVGDQAAVAVEARDQPRHPEGAEVIVPNSDLISQQVVNWTLTRPRRRIELRVRVLLGSNPAEVISVLEDVAREHHDVLKDPPPNALFFEFGDGSLDFVLRPDVRFPRWLSIIGAVTVAAFIGFLVSLQTEGLLAEDGLAAPDVRQSLWIVPTLEWALIVGILAWVFLTAWTWRRATR